MVTTVKMPFTFEPQVQAMKKPVAINQLHHSTVNSLVSNTLSTEHLGEQVKRTSSGVCEIECMNRL
jgi:hypothetical protein